MKSTPLRIIFFGTPEFAAYSLALIHAQEHHIVAVVTSPDKPAGRGMKMQQSAVKKTAERLNLPLLQPPNLKDQEFQKTLRDLNADLGIVIAFRMLPEAVWSMPRLGTFNLHASLLPKYRGAAPINHAIMNGEKETGVTTFFLKHEIDTGDIVLQKTVSIEENDNAGSLHDKLMKTGAELVIETLRLVAKGNWESIPQYISPELPMAPKLSRESNEINSLQPAQQIHNKIRGLSPYPGAWAHTEWGQIKIFDSSISPRRSGKPGFYIENDKIYCGTADNDLEILELQPAGKPRMNSKDFVNGTANKR